MRFKIAGIKFGHVPGTELSVSERVRAQSKATVKNVKHQMRMAVSEAKQGVLAANGLTARPAAPGAYNPAYVKPSAPPMELDAQGAPAPAPAGNKPRVFSSPRSQSVERPPQIVRQRSPRAPAAPAAPRSAGAAAKQSMLDLQNMMAGYSASAAAHTEQVLLGNSAARATTVAGAKPAPTNADVAGAAATLIKYLSDNNLTLLNANDLYELSCNPNVTAELRKAAKFMVENPDVYRDIEVAGLAGPDQVNSAGEMQQTAAALPGDARPYVPKATSPAVDATPTPANISKATGFIAQHMKNTGAESLDVTDLNKLVYDPTVSDDVRKAAKFLLQNSDVYAHIEANSAA